MDEIVKLDLSFQYNNSKNYAIKDFKETIKKGEVIVLCGHSGCGKSSILRSINHLIPSFYEGNLTGSILINNEDLKNLSIGEVGKMASSVFQDPRSQFFTLNSSLEVSFGLENFGYSHEEIIKRVNQAFKHFNLEYLKMRDVFSLSSGERQLIAILDCWAMDTDILLLDEPTANLDYLAIEKLKEMLIELKNEGKTIIISEHRLYYLKDIATRYFYMYKGTLKKTLTKSQMDNLSYDDLEKLGLRSINLSSLQNEVEFNHDKITKTFEIKNISYKYKHYKENVLNNINLNATNNEIVGIIGANGCGKTTFGKIACGLYKQKEGTFIYNNKKLNQKNLRKNAIFIMQEAEFQFFTSKVIDELTFNRVKTKELMERIEFMLKKVDMWELRNSHPFNLSGGQMQKLVLLIAYFSNKNIVFLDEPTAGLDKKSLNEVIYIINEMKKTKLIFIITHDLELISKAVNKLYAFRDGLIDKTFNLEKDNILDIKNYMNSLNKENKKTKKEKIEKNLLDARIKIFIILTCMVLGIFFDVKLLALSLLGILFICLYESKFYTIIVSSLFFSTIYLLYKYIPSVTTTFIYNFFPRIILIGVSFYLSCNEKDAPYILAGLRKLKTPEIIIMIISMIFRFFPVLTGDLKIMNQSLKTRKEESKIFKGMISYMEIMIVPMIYRVIRIAETLSASCETRGISLKTKRESFLELKINFMDIILLILFITLVVLGFIL